MKLNNKKAENNIVRALHAFNRLRRLLISLESRVADMDLSKPELIALDLIFQKSELIMSEISEGLNIGVSTATGIVDRLFEKGLVSRERNHGDRRIVRIKLTKKGKQKANGYRGQMKKAFERILASLTKKEQQMLILIMEKIAKIIK